MKTAKKNDSSKHNKPIIRVIKGSNCDPKKSRTVVKMSAHTEVMSELMVNANGDFFLWCWHGKWIDREFGIRTDLNQHSKSDHCREDQQIIPITREQAITWLKQYVPTGHCFDTLNCSDAEETVILLLNEAAAQLQATASTGKGGINDKT